MSSAIWGGLIGLGLFSAISQIETDGTKLYVKQCRDGLEQFSRVMVLFVFSALLLGFGHPVRLPTPNLNHATGASGVLMPAISLPKQTRWNTSWAVVSTGSQLFLVDSLQLR